MFTPIIVRRAWLQGKKAPTGRVNSGTAVRLFAERSGLAVLRWSSSLDDHPPRHDVGLLRRLVRGASGRRRGETVREEGIELLSLRDLARQAGVSHAAWPGVVQGAWAVKS